MNPTHKSSHPPNHRSTPCSPCDSLTSSHIMEMRARSHNHSTARSSEVDSTVTSEYTENIVDQAIIPSSGATKIRKSSRNSKLYVSSTGEHLNHNSTSNYTDKFTEGAHAMYSTHYSRGNSKDDYGYVNGVPGSGLSGYGSDHGYPGSGYNDKPGSGYDRYNNGTDDSDGYDDGFGRGASMKYGQSKYDDGYGRNYSDSDNNSEYNNAADQDVPLSKWKVGGCICCVLAVILMIVMMMVANKASAVDSNKKIQHVQNEGYSTDKNLLHKKGCLYAIVGASCAAVIGLVVWAALGCTCCTCVGDGLPLSQAESNAAGQAILAEINAFRAVSGVTSSEQIALVWNSNLAGFEYPFCYWMQKSSFDVTTSATAVIGWNQLFSAGTGSAYEASNFPDSTIPTETRFQFASTSGYNSFFEGIAKAGSNSQANADAASSNYAGFATSIVLAWKDGSDNKAVNGWNTCQEFSIGTDAQSSCRTCWAYLVYTADTNKDYIYTRCEILSERNMQVGICGNGEYAAALLAG